MKNFTDSYDENYKRLLSDLGLLCQHLEVCIGEFYDLGCLSDEAMVEVLGLNFMYRSLLKFLASHNKERSLIDG